MHSPMDPDEIGLLIASSRRETGLKFNGPGLDLRHVTGPCS